MLQLSKRVLLEPLTAGSVLALTSFLLAFHAESMLARNMLGLLIGVGYSPAVVSSRSDSVRYFAQCLAMISFLFMVLAGFRWPLILAFFVLAVSALSEFETEAMMELLEEEPSPEL